MDTSAVVTPNCAIARRTYSSYPTIRDVVASVMETDAASACARTAGTRQALGCAIDGR